MSSTILMVILICVGCVIALAGLGVLAHRGFVLFKAARAVGATSAAQVQVLSRRLQELPARIEETTARQKEVAERLEDLSAATGKLEYLLDQLDAATGRLSSLKSP